MVVFFAPAACYNRRVDESAKDVHRPGSSGDSGPRAPGRRRLILAVLAAAVVLSAAGGLWRTGDPAPDELALRAAQQTFARALRPRPASSRGLSDPPRVGLQVGHWRMDEMPDELARLRDNTGARWGSLNEVDFNQAAATAAAEILRAHGVLVDVLPGAVPPGYTADAFVAIHADGAARPGARGWKVTAPWRGSQASRGLADSLAAEYGRATGLPEDRYGLTANMKGYYAFSWHRFHNAIGRNTPAAIIEAGFVTEAGDRAVLFGRTDAVAGGIAAGILRYLDGHSSFDWRSLVAVRYASRTIGPSPVDLRALPEVAAPVRAALDPGVTVIPIHRADGWVEVIVRGNYRSFGWVRESDLET